MKSHFTTFQYGAVLCLMIAVSFPAAAVLYTSSNEAEGNRVIVFNIIKPSGNLREIGSFDTGGTGTSFPLENQSAMMADAGDRWLFVTNAGDGSISSFQIQGRRLRLVNRVASGGTSAISVAVFGRLVYVLNEGDGDNADESFRYDNISGFRFNNGGELTPIPDSTRILDNTQLTSPAQVGFNRSGTVLLVTEKATGKLTTYVMQADGLPAATPRKRGSAIPVPFGFEFGDRDFVFVTEAGAEPGVTASYRVNPTNGAVSPLIDMIEQGNAACWTALSTDQTVGYTTNTASDSVSPYRINSNGTLRALFRSRPGLQVNVGAGTGPRDVVITQDNKFLYTLNDGNGSIRAFSIRAIGSLSRRGSVPVPSSATGLVAR